MLPIVFHQLPLMTLFNALGTEDTDCCSFSKGICVHSCWIQDFSCSAVRGCCCLVLLFKMLQHFQQETDVDCRQASQAHTLCLYEAAKTPEITMDLLGKYIILMVAYMSLSASMAPPHIWSIYTSNWYFLQTNFSQKLFLDVDQSS